MWVRCVQNMCPKYVPKMRVKCIQNVGKVHQNVGKVHRNVGKVDRNVGKVDRNVGKVYKMWVR